MHFFAFLVYIAFGVVFSGCANLNARKPDPKRQPWRDSWMALPAARAAEPDGLHRSFQAAYNQVNLPYENGGEDAEGIAENLHGILKSIGDQQFSKALLLETPETRTAVRDCMFESEVKNIFPKTHEVLRQAPFIKWPSDIAYEKTWVEAGQKAPVKKGWTQ